MTRYAVTRTIDADAETVWSLLTDVAAWREWNPTIVDIDGAIREGEKVRLVSTANPKRAFKLAVTSMTPPHEMVWADGMPLGLFRGVRTYRLTPDSAGSTEFSMEEVYSGLLAPLITKAIPDLSDSFTEFADGLKAAAESASK
jgi:hypothetical protein